MSMVKYPASINEKLQLVETVLDGVVQHLQKGGDGQKYLSKLRKALGCVRAIQAEYPQPSYSLFRFTNKDEIPSERELWQKTFKRNRSLARSDWHAYKRIVEIRTMKKIWEYADTPDEAKEEAEG